MVVTFDEIRQSDQIEKDRMGGACFVLGEMREILAALGVVP